MKLLDETLHVIGAYFHNMAVETIKFEGTLHRGARHTKVLPKVIFQEHSVPVGELISNHQVRLGGRILGTQDQRTTLVARPLSVFAVHIHQPMSQSSQGKRLTKSMMFWFCMLGLICG